MIKSQIEDTIDEMLGEPPQIFVVTVQYCDGTFGFYTFDNEEFQVCWIEQLAMNARPWNIERVCYGESVLNYNDHDRDLFIIH